VLSAAFIVAQPGLLAGRDAAAVTAVQMGAAAAVALPIALAAGTLPSAAPTLAQGVNAIALITVGSLVPFALYAYGQKHVSAEVAGAFVNLEPLVGAAIGALAFGDPFGSATAVGGVIVVMGMALAAGLRGPRALP
jgi:drug/metabolite transporter (DMT)-like permease